MTVKIEINTYERSPSRPIVQRSFGVDNPWFTGEAAVSTFDLTELIATKIRGLFQRKKGRDLFDLGSPSSTPASHPPTSRRASSRIAPTAGAPVARSTI